MNPPPHVPFYSRWQPGSGFCPPPTGLGPESKGSAAHRRSWFPGTLQRTGDAGALRSPGSRHWRPPHTQGFGCPCDIPQSLQGVSAGQSRRRSSEWPELSVRRVPHPSEPACQHLCNLLQDEERWEECEPAPQGQFQRQSLAAGKILGGDDHVGVQDDSYAGFVCLWVGYGPACGPISFFPQRCQKGFVSPGAAYGFTVPRGHDLHGVTVGMVRVGGGDARRP